MIKNTFATMTLVAILSTAALSPVNAEVQAGADTAPIPAARMATFFQNFASVAIPSVGKATVTKDGKAGVFGAYNPATGKALALAGVGGAGTFTAKASGKSGPCASVAGVAVTNGGAGSESFNYYQLNCPGEQIPTTTNAANALFEASFGKGSLRGQSLTVLRSGPNGRVLALSSSTFETINWHTWSGVKATTKLGVVRSIALIDGKLCAIYSSGSGTLWGKYAK